MDVEAKKTYSQDNGAFFFSTQLTDAGGEHARHRIP